MSSTPLAVVTGAGSGIGLALTHALLARDCDVVAIDLDPRAIDPRAERHAVDTRDAAAMQAIADAHHGQPAAYVFANAGVGGAGDVLGSTDAAWSWTFDVNVVAVLRTLRLWWPALLAGRGKAVATVSAAALQSYPGAGPYRASKAALLSALEGLHYEAAGSGVGVHALCPGLVRSNILDLSRYAEAAADDGLPPGPFASFLRQAMRQAETAENFAQRVLDGLDAGAPFYWLTHPETEAWIDGRHRAIRDRVQPFSDFGQPPAR